MATDWTNELKATLRAHWDGGLSTGKIGRAMGLSKNSVVGAAHRMKLPLRPNPIKRGVVRAPKPPAPLPRNAVTLSPLAAVPAPVVVALRPVATPSIHGKCQYLLGTAATRPRYLPFCDAPAVDGTSWCTQHARICFGPRAGHGENWRAA